MNLEVVVRISPPSVLYRPSAAARSSTSSSIVYNAMERTGSFNVMSLFSRGASPPPDTNSPSPSQLTTSSTQYQQSQQQHPLPPPSQSYHENSSSASPPQVLDNLFRNISQPPPSQPSEQAAPVGGNNPFRAPQPQANNSAPTTPVSSTTVGSGQSAPANIQPADRQSALLSLLGSVASPSSTNTGSNTNQIPSHPPVPPPHPPTPPIDQRARAMPSGNEAQGKILLEQLMSGMYEVPVTYNTNSNTVSYNEPPMQGAYPTPGQYPGRIYGPLMPNVDPYQPREAQYISQDTPRDNLQQPLIPQQQQPPSPGRKSLFDYVSPFDALAPTTTGKKKTDMGYMSAESRDTEDSWATVPTSVDPKRKSVENLMDQLARSQAPVQTQQPSLDPYDIEPSPPPTELAQLPSKLPPPKQLQSQGSPHSSPALSAQRPHQVRSGDSPLQSASSKPTLVNTVPSVKERSGSPLAKSSWKAQDSKQRVPAPRKPLVNPNTPSQNIVFDVAQSLESVQASRDYVRSTAIALVKVESTFLPGTTIGATHWVAYAMTRGRVRVISRSSGDRTLLQLPSVFGNTVSVTDMAVHGNRLAGVTSDGGFVVWELPELITDDVPGRLLVFVVPSSESDPLHSVKWHPRDPDVLAVASNSNLYLLNVADCASVYGGEPVAQVDLHRVAQIYQSPTPLASFDFDIPHQAIATVTKDAILTIWSTVEKYPLWQSKIAGEGSPSSLNFVDAGVVIGRKSGTYFQLLPIMSDVVLSTIKFANAGQEDPDMFGHVTYDTRIQTLWVANSRRDSLIAFRISFDMTAPTPGDEEVLRSAYIDQVVEFVGPKPTIHFVILTADADPDGDEANAACIAAKLPPGELALVAFSVHSSGVDQVLIKKDWYDSAFASTTTKFPPYTPPAQAPRQVPQALSQPIPSVPVRLRTPPSEEVEVEHSKDEARTQDVKGKGAKGKNVGWKDRDDSGKEKGKGPAGESFILQDSPLGVALQKEIRKVEENLHTRIGRLIAKELDKQHQRLEEARANEQAADFIRQEKILKLISTELTKNTTRVVEMAVKGEVQNSVLPSLENITKTEVKSAVNTHIVKGLGDSMKNVLPPEIEKMLFKPEISSQIARNLSNNLTPFIERYVKEAISKTLVPAFQAQSTTMHQELSREIHSEIVNLKKEVIQWQSDALRTQEDMIRDMGQSIRTLSEQIKFLTLNTATLTQSSSSNSMNTRNSPGPASSSYGPSPMSHRGAAMPPMGNQHGPFPAPFQSVPPPPPPPSLHGQWYPNIPGTHTTPPVVSGPPTQQAASQPTAGRPDEWDDTYLAVLGTQDLKQLRELLARSNPEVIMPTSGPGPLSQAVILTLVHRLAGAIGETSPVDEAFKSSLWWLQRAATSLNTNDPLISPYTARVLPNVQQMLNTTKQRLAILPGGPQLLDTTRMISDIQDTLNRKPM